MYIINPNTAVATRVGLLGPFFAYEGALAFSPNGMAYGGNFNDSTQDTLFTINLTTGAATPIGALSGTHDINGLRYRSDGKLIGLDDDTNSLLVIDPNTLAYTTLAVLPFSVGGVGGMTLIGTTGYFATAGPDRNGTNSLYSFDPFVGTPTLIGTFDPTITGEGISGLTGLEVPPSAVPEPSSLALFALSGGALAGWRRWRKRGAATA